MFKPAIGGGAPKGGGTEKSVSNLFFEYCLVSAVKTAMPDEVAPLPLDLFEMLVVLWSRSLDLFIPWPSVGIVPPL